MGRSIAELIAVLLTIMIIFGMSILLLMNDSSADSASRVVEPTGSRITSIEFNEELTELFTVEVEDQEKDDDTDSDNNEEEEEDSEDDLSDYDESILLSVEEFIDDTINDLHDIEDDLEDIDDDIDDANDDDDLEDADDDIDNVEDDLEYILTKISSWRNSLYEIDDPNADALLDELSFLKEDVEEFLDEANELEDDIDDEMDELEEEDDEEDSDGYS